MIELPDTSGVLRERLRRREAQRVEPPPHPARVAKRRDTYTMVIAVVEAGDTRQL